jgi:sterol desaturase/sphingolipid hydroxylase (fatty acid hydroxylase superfamily)
MESDNLLWKGISYFGELFYIVPIKAEYRSVEDVPDYLEHAIPFFLLLIALEFLIGKYKNRTFYTIKDLIMSVSVGAVHLVVAMWVSLVNFLPYIYCYNVTKSYRETFLPTWYNEFLSSGGIVTFITGLVGVDLAYYFVHKYYHEYQLIWSAHSPHHSGERYNLATALRQGAFSSMVSWIFYLPLAIFGLPASHLLRHSRLNLLYQFWIHTECIGRLPPLFELIFNTPSHHRLHHRPPGNCNYAGVLIVFDRLFGTFLSELHLLQLHSETSTKLPDYQRGLIYGLAQSADTFDPLYINVQHYHRLALSQSVSQAQSHSSSSPSPGLLRYWANLGYMLLRKRVHQPIRLVTRVHELMPDIIAEYKLLNSVSIVQRFSLMWQRLWQLPPETGSSPRDLNFLRQRDQREAFPDTLIRVLLVYAHFLVALAYALVIMSVGKEWVLAGDYYRSVGHSVAAILALQSVKFHYDNNSNNNNNNSNTTSNIDNSSKSLSESRDIRDQRVQQKKDS